MWKGVREGGGIHVVGMMVEGGMVWQAHDLDC